jgi:hypothetical protein
MANFGEVAKLAAIWVKKALTCLFVCDILPFGL